MARSKPPLREAFNARYVLDRSTGCWLWSGMQTQGYGVYQTDKTTVSPGVYRRTRVYAHRISWEVHEGPIPEGMEVCHRCNVTLCVNPKHLFLGTHADNQADMAAKGRSARGEKQYKARLTEAQAREIMTSQASSMQIAAKLGVTFQAVSDIRCGRTWKHLGLTRQDDPKKNQGQPGSAHGTAVLTESDIPVIRLLLRSGAKLADLGRQYGVTPEAIGAIKSGKTWKHVT